MNRDRSAGVIAARLADPCGEPTLTGWRGILSQTRHDTPEIDLPIGGLMRAVLLSCLGLALVGCSPPPADATDESDQAIESTSAPVPPEAAPATPATEGSGAVAGEPFNEVPARVDVVVSESQMHGGTFALNGIAR